MYKCKNCNQPFSDDEIKESMGLCPICGRDSLTKFSVNCPFCGKDMGEPTETAINERGWGCVDCSIKVYKEVSK